MSAAIKKQRGYTVVEVMSAMTLFAIGAAGVIGMQRTTILGGDDARRMDIATNIAHEWTARLQRDAAFWTKPNPSDGTNNISETRWLGPAMGGSPSTDWAYPAVNATNYAGGSPYFDLYGRDRPEGSGDHMFCVQYRTSWITPLGTTVPYRLTAQLRVDVRVFWARLESSVGTAGSPMSCKDASPSPSEDQIPLRLRIHRHPPQRHGAPRCVRPPVNSAAALRSPSSWCRS
jgi:prepilin-type N-terminal cleavage/methylation domain-containing protein